MSLRFCGEINLCTVKIILSLLSFVCLLSSFLPLSKLCLHFLIVVNDKFCIVKVSDRFLVFVSGSG